MDQRVVSLLIGFRHVTHVAEARLREEKDLIIREVWKTKSQERVAREEKEREFQRLEDGDHDLKGT